MPAFFWQDVFCPTTPHTDLSILQIVLSEAAGTLIVIAIVLVIAYLISKLA